jgi:hypothetical protein
MATSNAIASSVLSQATAQKTGNFHSLPLQNLSLVYQPAGNGNRFPRWVVRDVDNEDLGTFYIYHPSNDENDVKAIFGNARRLQFTLFTSKRDGNNEIYLSASGKKVQGLTAPVNYVVIDSESACEMLQEGYVAKEIIFTQRQETHIEDIVEAKAYNTGNVGKIMKSASKEERQSFFGGLAQAAKNLLS